MKGKEKKTKEKTDSKKSKKVLKKIFNLKVLFTLLIIAIVFSVYQLMTRDKFVFSVSYLSSYSTNEAVDIDVAVYKKGEYGYYYTNSSFMVDSYTEKNLSEKIFDKLTNDNVKVTVSLYDADGKKVRGASEKIKTELKKEESFSLELPEGLEDGNYTLKIKAKKGLYHDEAEKEIYFTSSANDIVTISMDKGIYKPGDEVKFRALITDNKENVPVEKDVEIAIYDGNDNRVFYEETKTSEFGIVSGVFNIADEVNSGVYKLSVKVDGKEKVQGFTVESYTEERFKIEFNNLKAAYAPTDKVEFDINAKYFFGEPVVDATVVVTDDHTGKKEELHTNADGIAKYVGVNKDKRGEYSYSIEITDKSNYFVKKVNNVIVYDSKYKIEIVPEFNDIIKGVKNRIYVYVMDLQEKPVSGVCTFKMGNVVREFMTDENGVGFVDIASSDIKGTMGSISVTVQGEDGSLERENLVADVIDLSNIVRTDNVLYEQGQNIEVSIGNFEGESKLYVVKNNELIKTIDLVEEDSVLELDDTFGLIDLYMQGTTNGRVKLNKRTIFIKPKMDMKINLSTDSTEYKPSDNMTLSINSSEEEASAYLVSIIDTANLNMADNDLNIDKIKLALEDVKFTDGVDAATVYATIMSNTNKTDLEKLLMKQSASSFNITTTRLYSDFDEQIYRDVLIIIAIIFIIIMAVIVIDYNVNGKVESKILNIVTRVIPIVLIVTIVIAPVLYDILSVDDVEAIVISLIISIALYVKVLKKYEKLIAVTMYEMLFTIIFVHIAMVLLTVGFSWLGAPIMLILLAVIGIAIYKTRNRKWVAKFSNIILMMIKTLIMLVISYIGYGILVSILDIDYDAYPLVMLISICTAYYFLYKYKNEKNKIKEETKIVDSNENNNINKNRDAFYYIGVGAVILGILYGVGLLSVVKNFSGNISVDDSYLEPDVMYDGAYEMNQFNSFSDMSSSTSLDSFGDTTGASKGNLSIDSFLPDFNFSTSVQNSAAEDSVVMEETQPTVSEEEIVKIRNVFLESLTFMPEVIAEKGDVDVDVKLSDNITTWKVQVVGNTKDGDIAYSNTEFKVFKDFFVDFTVPNNLKVGDKISVPATIYNYTEGDLNVKLSVKEDSWFKMNNYNYSNIYLGAKEQTLVYLDIEVLKQGDNKLRVEVSANGLTDIIERNVPVDFKGVEISEMSANGNTDESISGQVLFTDEFIAESNSVTVNIYPNLLSFALEGMDSILRMPTGCFEQVSSSLYPDIMVLSYLENSGNNDENKEMREKAIEYINKGYQKLLTYEVPGQKGGFSLYGDPDAETVITAYGLLELYDLSKVYPIDEDVLDRMETFLSSKQNVDGSFKITGSYLSSITGSNSKLTQSTYIAWAISEYNPEADCMEKAVEYIKENIDDVDDPYTLGLMVNVLVNTDDKDKNKYIERLIDKVETGENDCKYLVSTVRDYWGTYSNRMNVQTTALLSMALSKTNKDTGLNNELLNYIVSQRGSTSWGTTQSTVFALRAINLYSEKSKTKDQKITVTVGDESKEVEFKKNGIDFVSLTFDNIKDSKNVNYDIDGVKNNIYYEVIKNYYVEYDKADSEDYFEITRDFSSNNLSVNDVLTETIEVKNTSSDQVENIMVEVQIPQGFVLVTDELEKAVANKTIEKYESNYGKVLIYLRSLDVMRTNKFKVEFRALYPVEITGGAIEVYDYYNPESIEYTAPENIKVVD